MAKPMRNGHFVVAQESSALHTRHHFSHQSPLRSSRSGSKLAILCGLGFMILIAAGLLSTLSASSILSQITKYKSKPCGENPEQAKAFGCIYDVMMNEWLTPDCYDADLTEEFKALHHWKFYANSENTQLISEQEVSESARAYTTIEYHIAHCGFSLRKLHRAIEHGRKIEINLAARINTDDCANYLRHMVWRLESVNQQGARNFSIDDRGTILKPSFPLCVDYTDIKQWSKVSHDSGSVEDY